MPTKRVLSTLLSCKSDDVTNESTKSIWRRKMKRLLALLSLFVIASMLFTACAPAATEAPATEAPATEAPATEAPATEAPATEAPATEAPATQAGGFSGTIKIATQSPLSGGQSLLGVA